MPSICTGGVVNSKAVSLPKPKYPKAVKTSGTVIVQVKIDEQGNVIEAKVCGGHSLLGAEAEKAAKQAKIRPTILSGIPVKVSGIIVYNFIPPE